MSKSNNYQQLSDIERMSNRIQALETRLSRQRKLLLVLVLIGVVAATLGFVSDPKAQNDKVVFARRFVVTDENGIERIVLGAKDHQFGIFVQARTTRDDVSQLVFLGAKQPIGSDFEFGHLVINSQVTPKVGTFISSNTLALYDDKEDRGINMSCFNSPSLEFVDRSGLPFVSLTHDSKIGTNLSIREPLGIKGAMDDVIKAHVEGKPSDPRIDDAYRKSLRIDLGARPFSAPYIELWKDGRLIWNAK